MTYSIIEPSKSGTHFNVYNFDTWPKSSVLSGMERKTFKDSFETSEEAQREYPEADVSDYILTVSNDIGACAPLDFDSAYAGESWDEE